MRGAIHRSPLVGLAGLLVSLGLACATPVDVAFDSREDFSRYRSWDWLPGAGRVVDAPDAETAALDRKLAHLLEHALRARGLERVHGGADLEVGVALRVQRKFEVVRETRASRYLPSFHDFGSYEVQVAETALHAYEECRLVVVMARGEDGRVIWRGSRELRCEGECAPQLEGLVADLLARFPPGAPSQ